MSGAKSTTDEVQQPSDGKQQQGKQEVRQYKWAWCAVAVILVGEILDLLDALVTTTAGPKIMADLGTSNSFIQWLGAGYTIAMAAGLLIGGRLGDIYGRRRLFLVGMTGFTIASLLSATAMSPDVLIACRVLQGLLGALMVPQALGMIREMFPVEKVGIALGLTGPVMASAGVAGPIFAGWLVDADYFGWGWRMIFAVNVPVGVAALSLGFVLLPKSRPDRTLRIDIGGAALAALAMAAIVFPLVQGRELGWPWWIWIMLVCGPLLLLLFARSQSRRARAGHSPLVEPSLFGKKPFLAGLSFGALFFSVMMGGTLLLSMYLQLGLGLSPLRSGVTLSTQAIGMVVGFGLSQALGMRRSTMYWGLTVTATGILGTLAAIWLQEEPVTAWWLSLPITLVGVGSGLVIAPFFGIVLSGVDDYETGSASGALTSAQQVGNSLGVAILGSVFFSFAGAELTPAGSAHAAELALFCALALVAAAAIVATQLPRRDTSGDGETLETQ
ncbi:MFS transporter [Rhodococcus sp. H29-C3]|uniref:MFS transporter n=1 Tax=Rhodococcus sp. H29-C3 TaxID=3046307 RepID=UPI0024BB61F1|nr:MFS transporter [Rhodococcus sp. H29-C3]MDJ0362474.1 MFS transporter [Rhodococcus sp. H29-C3]